MDTFVVETRVRFEGSGRERLQAVPARLDAAEAVLAEPPPVVRDEAADGYALVQFSIEADDDQQAQTTGHEVVAEALDLTDDDDRVAEVQVSARRLEPRDL